MTGNIIVKYLNELSNMIKIENSKVLQLLTDNFSAHELAVNLGTWRACISI
jgi:hypothetical protein